MWNKERYCWQLPNHVWIQHFCRSNWKITMLGKSAYFFVVIWHGGSCQEMCGTILWVGKQDDSTTLQSIYSMHRWPSLFKGKNWNPWENCQKYALKLFWNVYTWHVLEELIIYGQWTNLHDRSQNGLKLVTNDYLVWSLTFITHVNTNNIVMWVILQNNAGWDCFKTPILREILKIQNPLLEERCAFLKVIHLFQQVGFARSKHQFRTVQQNQKSFLWTQYWGWTVYPHLIYGIWSSQFFTETRIRVIKNGKPVHEPGSCSTSQTSKTKEISWNGWWSGQCWFYFLKRAFFSSGSFVLRVWRQRSSDQDDQKGKKPDNETCFQNPQSCAWLVIRYNQFGPNKFKSNTLTPRTNSQTCWQREMAHVMNGIIFCVCSTLAISVPSTASMRCWKEHKKMQVKKESQQNQNQWWIWSRDAAWGILTFLPLLHQKAQWKPDMKVKYLCARGMSSNQERGDL